MVGCFIGLLWFDLLRIRRQDAISNVLKVFPEKTKAEATSLARRSLIHMGHSIVEIFSFPFLDEKTFGKTYKVEIQGREFLDEALKAKKGAFLLAAHIGNGDLATAALSHAGWSMYLISKLFKFKALNDFWFKARGRHGTQFIAPRKSSYDILRALKKDGVVFFVLDQYAGPPIGIPTEFFGIKTGTASGLALLAARSGAPVLPIYSYRKRFGEHVIVIKKELPMISCENKAERLRVNTQAYNHVIEEMVKAHPAQWMWVHRRWKKWG